MVRRLIALILALLLVGCSLVDPRTNVSVEVTEVKGLLTSSYEVTVSNRNKTAVNCAVTLAWKTAEGSERKTVNVEVPAVGVAKGKVDPPAVRGTPTVQLESCTGIK